MKIIIGEKAGMRIRKIPISECRIAIPVLITVLISEEKVEKFSWQ